MREKDRRWKEIETKVKAVIDEHTPCNTTPEDIVQAIIDKIFDFWGAGAIQWKFADIIEKETKRIIQNLTQLKENPQFRTICNSNNSNRDQLLLNNIMDALFRNSDENEIIKHGVKWRVAINPTNLLLDSTPESAINTVANANQAIIAAQLEQNKQKRKEQRQAQKQALQEQTPQEQTPSSSNHNATPNVKQQRETQIEDAIKWSELSRWSHRCKKEIALNEQLKKEFDIDTLDKKIVDALTSTFFVPEQKVEFIRAGADQVRVAFKGTTFSKSTIVCGQSTEADELQKKISDEFSRVFGNPHRGNEKKYPSLEEAMEAWKTIYMLAEGCTCALQKGKIPASYEQYQRQDPLQGGKRKRKTLRRKIQKRKTLRHKNQKRKTLRRKH
jgi:hypothetical protein